MRPRRGGEGGGTDRNKKYLAFHYCAHRDMSSQGAPGPVADTGAAPGQHLAEVRQVMTEMVRTMRVSDDEDGPEMVLRLTPEFLPLAFPRLS